MGADAYGWVEICNDEADWVAIISASLLMERDYSVFATLFGVRNRFDVQPLAPNRGIPQDASHAVKVDAENFAFQPSWALWAEIKTVQWQEPLFDSWNLLFEMMASLAAHYGEEKVRLVTWFDQ